MQVDEQVLREYTKESLKSLFAMAGTPEQVDDVIRFAKADVTNALTKSLAEMCMSLGSWAASSRDAHQMAVTVGGAAALRDLLTLVAHIKKGDLPAEDLSHIMISSDSTGGF